jgi:hypothetical protein
MVADKVGIKDLSGKLFPLTRALCSAKKLFLSSLSRYWLDRCCANPEHLSNYRSTGYLPKLCAAISALKDYVRDMLYMWHTSNFRFLRPNKILGIGQCKAELPVEDARELPATWEVILSTPLKQRVEFTI